MNASKIGLQKEIVFLICPLKKSDYENPLHLLLFQQKLLDLVVKKSDNLTVDQLERLYSLLSQCIYRHRRDYDKSQLIEVMLCSYFYFLSEFREAVFSGTELSCEFIAVLAGKSFKEILRKLSINRKV